MRSVLVRAGVVTALLAAVVVAPTLYSPDVVRVSVGNSPTALTKVGESGASVTQWFQIPVQPVTARYVQVEFQKTSTGAAADWIFVDEIAVYPPS